MEARKHNPIGNTDSKVNGTPKDQKFFDDMRQQQSNAGDVLALALNSRYPAGVISRIAVKFADELADWKPKMNRKAAQ
jgi:hypothetical protein